MNLSLKDLLEPPEDAGPAWFLVLAQTMTANLFELPAQSNSVGRVAKQS